MPSTWCWPTAPRRATPVRPCAIICSTSSRSAWSASLARKAEVQISPKICGPSLLLPSLDSDIRVAFDRVLELAGIRPIILAEVDDMAMLRLLAREREGVTLVPPIVVRDELAAGVLVEHAGSRRSRRRSTPSCKSGASPTGCSPISSRRFRRDAAVVPGQASRLVRLSAAEDGRGPGHLSAALAQADIEVLAAPRAVFPRPRLPCHCHCSGSGSAWKRHAGLSMAPRLPDFRSLVTAGPPGSRPSFPTDRL